MQSVTHTDAAGGIVELQSESVLINNAAEALELMFSFPQPKLIIAKENVCPEFFDLASGVAGDIVQKFVNYGRMLAIVGDYSQFTSKSLMDFIRESNKTGVVIFPSSTDEAIRKLREKPLAPG